MHLVQLSVSVKIASSLQLTTPGKLQWHIACDLLFLLSPEGKRLQRCIIIWQ